MKTNESVLRSYDVTSGDCTVSFRSSDGQVTTSQSILEEFSQTPLKLVWQDVSYCEPDSKSTSLSEKQNMKQILQQQSGSISTGRLTAMMGPSGSGKTTLLNIIAGKITGNVDGDITVRMKGGHSSNLRIGFVPQNEHLFLEFSVFESVMFASRLNNHGFTKLQHQMRVNETLDQLDLTDKRGDRLSLLSGGQVKRVSIALELVSSPEILMLDEPTSGLDSDNAESVVRLLKKLASSRAIVATIHQPSADTFSLFHDVYLLSCSGHHIYTGPPDQVMSNFASFGFPTRCQINPAEHMLEIANGKYGTERFALISDGLRSTHSQLDDETSDYTMRRITDFEVKASSTFFTQTFLLFKRIVMAQTIKSPVTLIRVLMTVVAYTALCMVFDFPVGKESGCWTDTIGLQSDPNDNRTEEERLRQMIISGNNSLSIDIRQISGRSSALLMFVMMVVVEATVLPKKTPLFDLEHHLSIVRREVSNSWYSKSSFFVAHSLADILHMFIQMFPSVTVLYLASQLPFDTWPRFGIIFIAIYILGLFSEARITLLILLMRDSLAALTIDYILIFLSFFCCGIFAPFEKLTVVFQMMGRLSETLPAFRMVSIAMFGLDRCSGGQIPARIFEVIMKQKTTMRLMAEFWPTFNMTQVDMRIIANRTGLEETYLDPMLPAMNDFFGDYVPTDELMGDEEFESSFILKHRGISESLLTQSLVALTAYFLIVKLGSYFLLLWRMRSVRL